jgi:ubiquinone/menaquinone biosynthesis C-methylase UbiE
MDEPQEALAYTQADFAGVNQAFVDRLLELVGPMEHAEAADLGAGPADIPIRLARLRPGWQIAAIDASPAMLALAAKAVESAGLAQQIELVQADAKATGLPGGRFDVLFSNSILHHITDTAAFWRELKRLAKPHALVFLRDLARPDEAATARAIVEKYSGNEPALLKEEFYRSLLSAYTVEEVRQQLRQAGLTLLDVRMASDRHLDVSGRL